MQTQCQRKQKKKMEEKKQAERVSSQIFSGCYLDCAVLRSFAFYLALGTRFIFSAFYTGNFIFNDTQRKNGKRMELGSAGDKKNVNVDKMLLLCSVCVCVSTTVTTATTKKTMSETIMQIRFTYIMFENSVCLGTHTGSHIQRQRHTQTRPVI